MKKIIITLCLSIFAVSLVGCTKEDVRKDDAGHLESQEEVESLEEQVEPEILTEENEQVESELLNMMNAYKKFTIFSFEEVIQEGECDTAKEGRLVAYYRNLTDLETCEEELKDFKEYLKDQDTENEYVINYELRMESPLRYNIAESGANVMMDGDFKGLVTEFDESDMVDIIEKYLLVCIDYRFEDLMAQVRVDEIWDLVSNSENPVGICRMGLEEGPYVYYEDLAASVNGQGVSFGTLYRILQKEGFIVEGEVDGYTFYGKNEDFYEVSYDFHEKNPELSLDEDSYYYIKNGEKIWMAENFRNHFTVEEVKEITGLQLTIERK